MSSTDSPYYAFRRTFDTADVFIYGAIGAGPILYTAVDADLKRHPDLREICVRISSSGGSAHQSRKIYVALRSAAALGAHVCVNIEAVAASGGALVALAGDKVRIASNAFMMIHNPYFDRPATDPVEARFESSLLDFTTDWMAALIHRRTGLPLSKIGKMMDAETWFDALEALHSGLADEIIAPTELCTALRRDIPHEPGALAQRWGIWQGARNSQREHIRTRDQLKHMARKSVAIHLQQWKQLRSR